VTPLLLKSLLLLSLPATVGAIAFTNVPPATKQTAAGVPAFLGAPLLLSRYVFDFARVLVAV
jgi:hypothetical protein